MGKRGRNFFCPHRELHSVVERGGGRAHFVRKQTVARAHVGNAGVSNSPFLLLIFLQTVEEKEFVVYCMQFPRGGPGFTVERTRTDGRTRKMAVLLPPNSRLAASQKAREGLKRALYG